MISSKLPVLLQHQNRGPTLNSPQNSNY